MFPVRIRGHIGQRSEADPGSCMRWLHADRRRSQGLIRAGVREHDSQRASPPARSSQPVCQLTFISRRELDS